MQVSVTLSGISHEQACFFLRQGGSATVEVNVMGMSEEEALGEAAVYRDHPAYRCVEIEYAEDDTPARVRVYLTK